MTAPTPARAPWRPLASPALLAAALLLEAGVCRAAALRPRAVADERYAETFTFLADLEEGSYVQVQMAVTNLGPGSRNGLCRALVKPSGGAPLTAWERVPRAQWSHRLLEDGSERLAIGGCQATASAEGVSVTAALSGSRVQLRFSRSLAAPPAPAARIRAGKRFFESEILLAFTEVTATLALKGAAPRSLAGGGYADHSRSAAAPAELASRWARFRALKGGERVLLLARDSAAGPGSPRWLWREGGGFEPLEATLDPQDLKAAPACTLRITEPLAAVIRTGELLFRHAPLEELGALGALARPFLKVPVTWTWRARLESPGRAPVEGLLELTAFEE